MVAEIKSHVLRRDEKGMFGIPFKRLLGAGIGAVVVFVGLIRRRLQRTEELLDA